VQRCSFLVGGRGAWALAQVLMRMMLLVWVWVVLPWRSSSCLGRDVSWLRAQA
jgi:hypothetical protein